MIISTRLPGVSILYRRTENLPSFDVPRWGTDSICSLSAGLVTMMNERDELTISLLLSAYSREREKRRKSSKLNKWKERCVYIPFFVHRPFLAYITPSRSICPTFQISRPQNVLSSHIVYDVNDTSRGNNRAIRPTWRLASGAASLPTWSCPLREPERVTIRFVRKSSGSALYYQSSRQHFTMRRLPLPLPIYTTYVSMVLLPR
ncbi:hypothetical protein GGR50DRAFT_509081 [Xylaria sp. CBS 124048]|nr:hypothetical protein GGR50DRAFT_509081 [Xylaria sp. CBS 124048]